MNPVERVHVVVLVNGQVIIGHSMDTIERLAFVRYPVWLYNERLVAIPGNPREITIAEINAQGVRLKKEKEQLVEQQKHEAKSKQETIIKRELALDDIDAEIKDAKLDIEMRIAISERGVLRIERAGKMKDQFCPYSTTPDDFWSRCGDWCPLFREPIFEDNDRSQPWLLQICDASFFGEEEDFEDQRKKIGEDAK